MSEPPAQPFRVNDDGILHSGSGECRPASEAEKWFQAEHDRFGEALEKIFSVLGPNGGSCSANKCEGCKWEMDEAVWILRKVLNVS